MAQIHWLSAPINIATNCICHFKISKNSQNKFFIIRITVWLYTSSNSSITFLAVTGFPKPTMLSIMVARLNLFFVLNASK